MRAHSKFAVVLLTMLGSISTLLVLVLMFAVPIAAIGITITLALLH